MQQIGRRPQEHHLPVFHQPDSVRQQQRLTHVMNTYLYAPKDDPYHRERWTEPYPRNQWQALLQLIRHAQALRIDFVYGFHPGKGLCFSDKTPVRTLLTKARQFYEAGVRTFAVLFDDIPSNLDSDRDRKNFRRSLARAEGSWLQEIQAKQPGQWKDVEWWICPSYYTPDPLLARVFGRFEPNFLEILGEYLPATVPCFWTGPSVVSKQISVFHVQKIARRLKHPLLLWDNYPVNDLFMEGSSNVLSEALASSVPLVSSRIPGLMGTLGKNFPGYFPVGNTHHLAALLRRSETDKKFYRRLKRYCGALSHLVRPKRELDTWRNLLDQIG